MYGTHDNKPNWHCKIYKALWEILSFLGHLTFDLSRLSSDKFPFDNYFKNTINKYVHKIVKIYCAIFSLSTREIIALINNDYLKI